MRFDALDKVKSNKKRGNTRKGTKVQYVNNLFRPHFLLLCLDQPSLWDWLSDELFDELKESREWQFATKNNHAQAENSVTISGSVLNLLLAPDINLTLNSSLITSNECQNMKPIHFQVQTVASKFGKQSLIVNKFPDQDCQSHSVCSSCVWLPSGELSIVSPS